MLAGRPIFVLLFAEDGIQFALRHVEQGRQTLGLDAELPADHVIGGTGVVESQCERMYLGQAL